MAMQMVEDLHEDADLLLIGINKRGYFVAQMLEQALKASGLPHTSVINLDVHNSKLQSNADAELLAKAHHIILVDDVLFSGSTMIQAFRFVLDVSQPNSMKIAVLVDRGHRTFPIQPDYVGIVSPTKLREHVSVQFRTNGDPDSVRLLLSGS
jgi:pyrimidine operon attenuation protein/uracil phosphoribosyltransferase